MYSRICWLDKLSQFDRAVVGGKAAGLVLLCRIGANVPEGFVIPNGTTMDSLTRREIDSALQDLISSFGSSTTFAVRSSAGSEDSEAASYAGMYATLLGVESHRIHIAIEECRMSANSHRIATYKDALHRDNDRSNDMAVIIQRLLPSNCSGVCFTMNPISCDENQITVEAVEGLGERLVSGAVTPDYYLLDALNGDLLEYQPGDDAASNGPLLSEINLREVWNAATEVGRATAMPMDLEFSFAGGKLYLLQARPITTSVPSMPRRHALAIAEGNLI